MMVVVYESLRALYGIPYTRQHLGRLEKQGKFPRRFKLGLRRVVWKADEIEQWLQGKYNDMHDASA